MGLSIKNEEVEALVREYARVEGLGVTEAVARAIQVASNIERQERSQALRDEAIRRFLEIADKGWISDSKRWTRDELHER